MTMSAEVVKQKVSQIEIEQPSSLPKDFKYYTDAYQKELSEIYIKPELRSEVAVITARSSATGKNQMYLLFVSSSGTASEYARSFIQNFKINSQRFNVERLNLAKMPSGSKVLSHINEQFRSTNTVRSSSKTSNDVTFAEDILIEAMKGNASDIHVESQGNGMAIVRARINKELHTLRWITQKEAETFASVCYSTFPANQEDKGTARGVYKPSSILEGIFQRKLRDNQTGQEYYIKGRMINLSHNSDSNADFIIRLIDKNKNNKAKRFKEMNFSNQAVNLLKRLETINAGAIITCGVTGSGKSTSQQNMLQHERDRSGGKRKIISSEDPVEYDLDLITQITIGNTKEDTPDDNNFSFDNINTKNMRSDPDTLSYGEIRDTTTTKALIKGAMSGHLVYGTLHTSGAIEIFERLHDFGASMSDLCRDGFIRLVLFQHLLPRICPHCAIPYKIGDEIPEKYDEVFVAKLYMTQNNKSSSHDIAKLKLEADETGTSLFRVMQRRGLIDTATLKEMREKKFMLNESGDTEAFKQRLEKISKLSLRAEADYKIHFRGHGCKNCLDGQIGIAPAAEILVPDNVFLELIRNGQKTKAKLYWRTMLGGLTAAEDCYERIFDGEIDPRSVEEHLGELGS